MGITNFHTLEELATTLKEKIKKLSAGNLPIGEVEALTESAKEIYERLVIIRYKSYENTNEKVADPVQKPVVKKQEQKEDLVGSEEELMMFDFTDAMPEAVSETQEITEVKKLDKTNTQPEKEKQAIPEKKENSLNDHFKKEDQSVGKKLSKSPIADLKAHIGMNHKFTYIKELFNGKSDDYNLAIENLNESGSKAAAFSLLDNMKKAHKWDEENQTVINFSDLIERRFTN